MSTSTTKTLGKQREEMIKEIKGRNIFYQLVDFTSHSTSQIKDIYERSGKN